MRRVAWFAIFAAACGGDGSEPTGPRLAFDIPEGAPPPIEEIPFPNDVYKDADGALEITAAEMPFDDGADETVVEGLARALRESDCFGASGGVIFPLADMAARSVNPESLAGVAHIVDLELGSEIPAEIHYRSKEQTIHVRPIRERRLEQGKRHAFYLDDAIETDQGGALLTPPDFRNALAGDDEPRLARASAVLEPLREYLAASDIDPDDVAAATVFTTCEYDAAMQAIADAVLTTEPVPPITIDRVYLGTEALDGFLGTPADNTMPGWLDDGVAHESVGAIVLGSFESAYFTSESPGSLGRIEFEGGAPVVKSYDDVTFLLSIPADAESYENLPVVVFQHGLGSGRKHPLVMANTMATHGFAVIGIDIPFHGYRAADARDLSHNFTDADSPDGLADDAGIASLTEFFDLSGSEEVDRLDPLVMADNFRQSAADIIALSRVVTEGDWSPLGTAEPALSDLSFDTDRLVYSSESFGGFVGTTAVAFSPAYKAAWFTVAGGGLADHLLGNSAVYGPFFIPIMAGTFSVPPNELDPAFDPPHTHYVFQLLSMLLDAGDPLTYAPRLRQNGVHVVLASAYGDEAVPNQSSEALAAQLALAWAPVEGAVEGGPSYIEAPALTELPVAGNLEVGGASLTGAFFEMAPATHGIFTVPQDERHVEPGFPPFQPIEPPEIVDNPIRRVQTLMARYAQSFAEDGVPTLEAGSDL